MSNELDKASYDISRYINQEIEKAVRQKLEFLGKNPDFLEKKIAEQKQAYTDLKQKADALEAKLQKANEIIQLNMGASLDEVLTWKSENDKLWSEETK